MKRLFTSESVTEGHPDKLCDYISDNILDSYLAKDKNARVACETVAGKGEIFITGEITSTANVDIEQVVRDTIKEVGYADSEYDIDYRTCKIYINLSKQSPDIALGVDKSLEDKEGKDILIGFNPKFLIDALKVIDDETIHLYLMNPKAPCFIRDDDETYTYLILPVNISQNQTR